MVDLDFAVEDVEVERHAVAPLLQFTLRVTNTDAGAPVHNVMLKCQIRIEPTRRHLWPHRSTICSSDLFGTPERWGQTLQSILWTHSNILVPGIRDANAWSSFRFLAASISISLRRNISTASKTAKFRSFSCSAARSFIATPSDDLQIDQIAWTKESAYRLPVRVWRSMMDHYYPQTTWLCLRRDAFDELYRYKRARGLPSFETALDELLDAKLTSATS